MTGRDDKLNIYEGPAAKLELKLDPDASPRQAPTK